jgi:hypothetical protein
MYIPTTTTFMTPARYLGTFPPPPRLPLGQVKWGAKERGGGGEKGREVHRHVLAPHDEVPRGFFQLHWRHERSSRCLKFGARCDHLLWRRVRDPRMLDRHAPYVRITFRGRGLRFHERWESSCPGAKDPGYEPQCSFDCRLSALIIRYCYLSHPKTSRRCTPPLKDACSTWKMHENGTDFRSSRPDHRIS